MANRFVEAAKSWSRCARLNIISSEEFAYKFFEEVGFRRPTDEELLVALEGVPDCVLVELLRKLEIYYEAEYIEPAAVGGGGVTKEQRIAMAKSDHPAVKQACEFLKPVIVSRIAELES